MTAREWQPGDVAMLGSSVALRVTYDPFGCPATHAHDGDHWHRATGDWVIDGGGIEPHPLVVIDPEDREQVKRLMTAFHADTTHKGTTFVERWQAALREFANPTPPKPEVYEHLAVSSTNAVALALCGKTWQPNREAVTVVGKCPECAEAAAEGWVA